MTHLNVSINVSSAFRLTGCSIYSIIWKASILLAIINNIEH